MIREQNKRCFVWIKLHFRSFSWEQEYVGLLVDKVEDVVPMEDDLLRPPPENVSREQAAMFKGVFRTGEKLVTLLDLDTTLHLNRSAQ
ncbi:MAG: chemotaxis protein CheW [Candidatus Riflebacteria bacterium]|nr:chemotaxis protein CheW [Candidatus Riflebacteria bacterium]